MAKIGEIKQYIINSNSSVSIPIDNTKSLKIGISIDEKEYMKKHGKVYEGEDPYPYPIDDANKNVCFFINNEQIWLGYTQMYQTIFSPSTTINQVDITCPDLDAPDLLAEIVYIKRPQE